MERVEQDSKLGKRLLLFPLPFQGHITPMLHLAILLYAKGFSITIIQTHYKSLNPTIFPHLTFYSINDGLSMFDEAADSQSPFVLVSALNTNCLEPFRECLSWIMNGGDANDQEPAACLIADPMWQFAGSVADSFKLPRVALRTGSMSAFVVYDYLSLLREKGYFHPQETRSDEPVPELAPLKVKDLPLESQHDFLAALVKETKSAKGIICNSFEELESSAFARVQRDLPIPVFLIGPLHSHSPASSSSTSGQDQTTMSWLDTRAPNSVIYVSFGSVVTMSKYDVVEIAWGLAHSMQPFLWVIRSGLVVDVEENDPLPEGFFDYLEGRGHIVKWAPQNDILAHPAIGGFLTHCGWNSTLESISAGVPMICLPLFADQAINARYVSEEWNIGLQLEAGVKREDVVKAVRRLMVEEEGEEMRNRVRSLKEQAKLAVIEGGSSYKSLESLTSFLIGVTVTYP